MFGVTTRERLATRWAVAIGLAATIVICALQALGALDRLEYRTLDLRFRYVNPVRESDDLVRIDIDDTSLARIGRWPWPRFQQAQLIDIPAELGARALLLDIEYIEPEPLSVDPAALPGLPGSASVAGADALRWSDDELQAAIRRSGAVYLAFHAATQAQESQVFRELVRQVAECGALNGPQFVVSELQRSAALTRGLSASLVTRAALAGALAGGCGGSNCFDAPLGQISRDLGLPAEAAEREYPRALEIAADLLVDQSTLHAGDRAAALLSQGHEPSFRRFTADPPENQTARIAALRAAAARVDSRHAMRAGAYPPDPALAVAAIHLDELTPVWRPHAQAARRCGFSIFEPDADGVTRRVPLLGAAPDGWIFPQLAVAAAEDVLSADTLAAIPPARAAATSLPATTRVPPRFEPHARVLRIAGRAAQLDPRGATLIPWGPPGGAAAASRRHVPAEAVLQVARLRRQIAENAHSIRDRIERILASDFFAQAEHYATVLQAAKTAAPEPPRAAWHAALVAGFEAPLWAQWFAARAEHRELALLPPGRLTPAQELRLDQIELLQQELAAAAPLQAANARLQAELAETCAALQQRLAGKLCLIGYTATALADMVPTPVSRRAPGVLAHYWLLNGLLTDQLFYWTSPLYSVLLTLLIGATATFAMQWRPRARFAWWGLLAPPTLALLYVAVAAAAFYAGRFLVPVAAPLAALCAAVGLIAFHRYAFIERERRQLATALAQYTSKAIARQVAENPELCRRAESRDVTVVFTDLRGFTKIAERIGPQRTQRVLNACLERCTDVLLRHEAMVNKFMGDGIFAFWNPVIFEQPDHALRACEAAVDLQTAMHALAREQAAAGGDAVFAELVTRVGIATGNAVVGPCGSAMKYDYTCIGDSVNVASRLESANKSLGTLMLVNDDTRRAVADRFAFRPLGGVRVKGRQQAVQVFELLGRAHSVAPAELAYADAFAAAVSLYQQRRFAEALIAFEDCLRQKPQDLAAECYRTACEQFLAEAPPETWSGAIELTEK